MSDGGTAIGGAMGRVGLFCFVVFGVIAGFNPLVCAQDVVAYTTPGALSPPDLPPDGYGTYNPEPMAPPEGVALAPPSEGLPPVITGGVTPGAATISPVPNRFQYGLSLSVRGVYDDNINLTRFNKLSDWYVAIEPAVAIGFGDVSRRQENYIRLDYAPSILLFTDHTEENAVQHVIRLEGQYRFSRLTLNLTQDVQILKGTDTNSTIGNGTVISSVNLDVAGRTQVNVYRTHLGAAYVLTDKTFLSSDAEYSIYDYGSLISSERFLGHLFINYNYSPKLVIGIGGGGGYEWVDSPNPNQTFEQANVRATYQATGKISLYVSGGVEFRQFDNASTGTASTGTASTGTYVSPVYELGATYQPFDGTEISVRGNMRIQNSAVLAGQDFVLSNIIVGVRQRLFQRVYIGVTGGYEHDNYFSTIPGVSATRDDNYYIIEPSVDVRITKYLDVGGYYLHRENASSGGTFGFVDNQVGLRAKLTF